MPVRNDPGVAVTTRRTILVCDDEEGVRESIKLVLSDDYDIQFAHNGLEAIEQLKNLSPAVMLLDVKMPKVNGMETLKQIKRMKPKLPVIVVTGYQSVETAQEAIKNGASDYIPKPFESAHLKKAIAQLIK